VAKNPYALREALKKDARIGKDVEITRGAKGAIVGTLNRKLGGDDVRKLVLGWLFGITNEPLSSSKLTNGQWYALERWIGMEKIDDEWCARSEFLLEAVRVKQEVLRTSSVDSPLIREAKRMGAVVTELDAPCEREFPNSPIFDNIGEEDSQS
jgi:hypothetical protein